jgi:hypothetical protein
VETIFEEIHGKKINKNYVIGQLKKLKFSSSMSIKMTDSEGNKTHFIGLNDLESIEILIDYLQDRKSNFLQEEDFKPFDAETYFNTISKCYGGK